eukprot:CAMPEP_0116857246 /NCGR_PEP_ID=MMETSP0418-20121206/20429_1 /TAXON_ID=1158023 /ORGANISM="Astrosyne radiata, Strain 13vi08-1A" /LENGTH=579 /DNA_ID=CAMNT_0004490873 /DNA_START=62 /DNA_END=1801 /DNA_ORIENTATION=-
MKVEISLHASKLTNVAGAFKGTSDPYAVVTEIATTPGSAPKVLGKTEVIKNNLSPNWTKVFPVEYELGQPVTLAISIIDEVRKGDNIPMGSTTFEVGECLGARGNTKARKLKQGGTLFCHVAKSQGSGVLKLNMKASHLKNTEGFFSKSDPFYELSSQWNSGGGLTWDAVHRSEVIRNNLNPDWKTNTIELSSLCQGDFDKPILIKIFDHEKSGNHVLMGEVESTVNQLQSRPTYKLKVKGHETGTLVVTHASTEGVEQVTEQLESTNISSEEDVAVGGGEPYASSPQVPPRGSATFVDYVSGGCELNVCVAIDFTGSNGDPRKPGTLHHFSHGGEKNDYEKAITSILNILSSYDSDQKYPVYGFGAKYDGIVRHCFQCGSEPEVQGVDGVMDAYHQVFRSGLIMSAPTVFTEVIQTAAAKAASAQEAANAQGQQAYTILLIISDGAVSDVNATAQVLAECSQAPLSIVIVGVGQADFSSMQFLDDSQPPERDIAQFVEFNNYSNHSVELTKETLKEIPDQLTRYFQSRGIQPLPPVSKGDDEIMIEPEEDEEIDLSLDFVDEEIVIVGGGTQYHRSNF